MLCSKQNVLIFFHTFLGAETVYGVIGSSDIGIF